MTKPMFSPLSLLTNVSICASSRTASLQLSIQNTLERVRIDVAAAKDDAYSFPCESLTQLEQAREAHGACPFDQIVRERDDGPQAVGGFRIGNGHEVGKSREQGRKREV